MDPITQLPKPGNGRPDVLIIAGEHSGDEHAAKMVRELLSTHSWAKVCAFGGPKVEEAGAQLIYNMVDHSVVGLVEVLKNYFFFRNLMRRTIAWITLYRPRVVCFVDYPGFNLRVAEQLYNQRIAKQNGGDVTLLYYISPQIWAWKAKRRFKMADLLDGLAVIFPFEVDCYRDTQLPVRFVGHPFMDEDYVMPVRYDKKGAILLLPGSRTQPVSKIFPAMARAWALAAPQLPKDEAIVLYPSEKIKGVLERVLEEIPEAKVRLRLQKIEECTPAKAVLTSSGTMSLACALAGIPGAIAYRTHPLTFEIGRRVVKLKHLGIANILLNDSEAYKEYLQDDATPQALANALLELVFDQSSRARAFKNATRLMDLLTEKVESTPAKWLADNLGDSFRVAPVAATKPPRGVPVPLDATPPPMTKTEHHAGHEITLPPITPIQEIPVFSDGVVKPQPATKEAEAKAADNTSEAVTSTAPTNDSKPAQVAIDVTKEPAAPAVQPVMNAKESPSEHKAEETKKEVAVTPAPAIDAPVPVAKIEAKPQPAAAEKTTEQPSRAPEIAEKKAIAAERLKQPPHVFCPLIKQNGHYSSVDTLASVRHHFGMGQLRLPEPVEPMCEKADY